MPASFDGSKAGGQSGDLFRERVEAALDFFGVIRTLFVVVIHVPWLLHEHLFGSIARGCDAEMLDLRAPAQ